MQTDECIIWPFGGLPTGYGVLGKEYVHALACEHAHGPRPSGYHAAHGPCHQPACMNPRHVSWKTPTANHRDKRRDGTVNWGTRNGGAKLTEDQMRAIRQEVAAGHTQQSVAISYGISNQHVSRIVSRKKWADFT